MDKKRDAHMRVNTSSQSDKLYIKDSNINMDKKRDTSMRANTSSNVNKNTSSSKVTNIDYLQSNKMPIKDSNINMDKKSKQMAKVRELISGWIASARQYDPIARSILMHPEMIKTFVQISINNPVTT